MDTVSQIVWDRYNSEPAFATASWDGFVRYYLVKSNNREVDRVFDTFLQQPVLTIDVN